MVWPVADRQRAVVVGADGERLVDEDVARHRGHRRQHDLVADALLAQALDHPRAGARRRHADAGILLARRAHRPELRVALIVHRRGITRASQSATVVISSWLVRSICSGVTDT